MRSNVPAAAAVVVVAVLSWFGPVVRAGVLSDVEVWAEAETHSKQRREAGPDQALATLSDVSLQGRPVHESATAEIDRRGDRLQFRVIADSDGSDEAYGHARALAGVDFTVDRATRLQVLLPDFYEPGGAAVIDLAAGDPLWHYPQYPRGATPDLGVDLAPGRYRFQAAMFVDRWVGVDWGGDLAGTLIASAPEPASAVLLVASAGLMWLRRRPSRGVDS